MGSNRSIDKAFKELDALDKALRNKIIRRGHRAALKVIVAKIKTEAPVDTGLVKRSVKIRTGKRKKDTITTIIKVSGGHPRAMIGQVEFGNVHQVANPFIRRSVASKRDEVIDMMAEVIEQGIKNGK